MFICIIRGIYVNLPHNPKAIQYNKHMGIRHISIFFAIIFSFCLNTFCQSESLVDTFRTVYCDTTIWMCREEPWVLIFEDEFDGNSLNSNNWDIIKGVPRDFYFEIQKAWHQEDNIDVSNGSLKIVTRHEFLPNM